MEQQERLQETLFSVDEPVVVEVCSVDGGGVVSLTVESATQPLTVDGWTSCSVRLVGRTDSEVRTPGRHRAYHQGRAFTITLTRLARRGSLVAYGAFVLEPERQFV
jgi:hypothetical protein